MFFKGVLLENPASVLENQSPNSHAAKRITFTSVAEVENQASVVDSYLVETVRLNGRYTAAARRRSRCDELEERLASNPELPMRSTN